MRHFQWTVPLITLACLLGTGESARAQYAGNPYSRPRVSPYINLLRGGSGPAINYYGIVRPEIEARAGIFEAQQQAQLNQQAISGMQSSGRETLITGRVAGFQNHMSYFQNYGGAVQGAVGIPGGGLAGGAARTGGVVGGAGRTGGRPVGGSPLSSRSSSSSSLRGR